MVLTRRIEHPLDMTVQDQGLHCCLPLRGLVLGLRKLGDVLASILERDKLATARKGNRFVEAPTPSFVGLQ